jgi:DNA-binding CsgD family transcriptional regulator
VLPQVPDVRTQIGANLSLAMLAQAEGSYDEAEAVVSDALSRYRRSGNRRMEAFGLATLGSIELGRGNKSAARDHLAASAAIFGQLGDVAAIAQVLERFVELAAAQRRPDGAIVLAAAAARLRERIEAPLLQTGTARFIEAVKSARREVGEGAAIEAWRRGEDLDHEQAVATALAITEPALSPDESPADEATPARSGSVLTPREQEVAALIARGLTNRQIADTLVITEGTAANHVVHILSKLGFGSRTQVAVWAVEHGLSADRP